MRSHAAAILAALLTLARPASAEVIEGWPCAGCVTIAPSARPDAGAPPGPRPLLVALHGDGGSVRAVVRAWRAAVEAAGVILLAPQCPRAQGCRAGSWWQWLASSDHDPAFLGAQIDAVEARYPVDVRRVFATGYSGGATYLGWYAPVHADRFAAVAHLAGGAPYRPACPACKLPVLFVLGATDPMIGPYTRPLHDWYESCGGHEIVWETLRGVTHESILQVLEAGRAKSILAWLLARPAGCLDAGAAPAAHEPDAGLPPAAPSSSAPAVDPPSAPPPPPPPPVPRARACACGVPHEDASSGAFLAGLFLTAAWMRKKTAGTREHQGST